MQQEALGWPSDAYYNTILLENLITNSEVTIDDDDVDVEPEYADGHDDYEIP